MTETGGESEAVEPDEANVKSMAERIAAIDEQLAACQAEIVGHPLADGSVTRQTLGRIMNQASESKPKYT